MGAPAPPAVGEYLFTLENVTLIPHLGYVVEDSYRHFYAGTIEDIEAWLDGMNLFYWPSSIHSTPRSMARPFPAAR